MKTLRIALIAILVSFAMANIANGDDFKVNKPLNSKYHENL